MSDERPFITIVIPTYSRPLALAACLDSLTRLNYPRDRFEAIVVDDGSETSPEAVVASFRGQHDVRLLTQPHAGPAAARNTGAAAARGQYLAFTDDDCAPDPNWLDALAAQLTKTPDHLIGGRIVNALPGNACSTASQLLVSYLYTYYNADPRRARFFTSNNLGVSTEGFHAMGGFDTTYTRTAAEDRDLCERWLYQGHRLSYAPEAIVYHSHALTLGSFWQQHFNYGKGALRFRQARAYRDQQRIKVEPPAFYLNMVRYPFSEKQTGQAFRVALLLILSQLANGSGFLWEMLAERL